MKDQQRVVELGNGVVLLQIQHDLDWASSPAFKETLLGLINGSHRAILCQVNSGLMVDSSGLEAIGAVQTRAHMHRTPFGLVCSDPNLRRLFRLTGLEGYISVYYTISEAFAQVGTMVAA